VSCQTADAGSPCPGIAAKTDPSPTSSQGTSRGSGAHGAWLETMAISASTGGRFRGASSECCNDASAYWSGIGAQLKCGPR
jgi:hypothetical protein